MPCCVAVHRRRHHPGLLAEQLGAEAHRFPVGRRDHDRPARAHPGHRVVERRLRTGGVDHHVVLRGEGPPRPEALAGGVLVVVARRQVDVDATTAGDAGEGQADRTAADHEDAGTGIELRPVRAHVPRPPAVPRARRARRRCRRATARGSCDRRSPRRRGRRRPTRRAGVSAPCGTAGSPRRDMRRTSRTTRSAAPRPQCRRRGSRRTRGPGSPAGSTPRGADRNRRCRTTARGPAPDRSRAPGTVGSTSTTATPPSPDARTARMRRSLAPRSEWRDGRPTTVYRRKD